MRYGIFYIYVPTPPQESGLARMSSSEVAGLHRVRCAIATFLYKKLWFISENCACVDTVNIIAVILFEESSKLKLYFNEAETFQYCQVYQLNNLKFLLRMESVKLASGIGAHGPQILYSGGRQPPPGHPPGAQVVHPPTTRYVCIL